MYTILLDSSGTFLNVGLAKDDILIEEVFYEAWQQQSEFMVVELNKLLDKYSLTYKDISSVVVGVGPGSYTGVRISLTIAKTIALACNAKVYAMSSLMIEGKEDMNSICLINARSHRSYIGVYNNEKVLLQDQIMCNEEVLKYISKHKNYLVCGDTKYLGIENKNFGVLKQMLVLKGKIKPIENALALKPVYMCD